jgi:hypothetical protein
MLGCTSRSFCHQFQTLDLLLELAQAAVKMIVGELALGILPAGVHRILCCCRSRHQLDPKLCSHLSHYPRLIRTKSLFKGPGEFRRRGMQEGESRSSTPVTEMPQIIMMPPQHYQFLPLAPQQYLPPPAPPRRLSSPPAPKDPADLHSYIA